MEMWPQTEEEAAPLIVEAIAIFKKFKPDAVQWLIPHVLESEGKGDWNTFTGIVRTGEPVSIEEKGAWGHEKWFVFCRPCWDYMTDAGRYAPQEAVDELLSHVFWRQRLKFRRFQMADLLTSTMIRGKPFYTGMKIHSTELCCSATQRIKDQVFPINNYPDLPLKECSQVWCKCDWDVVRPEHRHVQSTNEKAHAAGVRLDAAIINFLIGKTKPKKD